MHIIVPQNLKPISTRVYTLIFMEVCVSATECLICYEIYDGDRHSPRLLTRCGHTICEKCLKDLCVTLDFKCPLCQITYFSNNGDLTVFPKNFALMSLMNEVGLDKHDFCVIHKEKFVFYDQTHARYLCPECFHSNKMSREDILTMTTLKKNLLVKTSVFVDKYFRIYHYLKTHHKDYFNSILKYNFQTYNTKLNGFFEQNRFSRNFYDALYQEFVKVFSMFYFLFKKYTQLYEQYRAVYAKFEKLIYFKDNANTKRITGAIIKETTDTLLELETVESVTMLERSKEIGSFFLVKDIMLKKFNDQFIDWALDIVTSKNIDDSGRISLNRLKSDFTLFSRMVWEHTSPIDVSLALVSNHNNKLQVTLNFWPDSNIKPIEFIYDSNESVTLLKDKRWCTIF